MLPLVMNGRLVHSAAQMQRYFSPLDMLRRRHAFAQNAHRMLLPLSDYKRCASLLFSLTLLHMEGKLAHVNLDTLPLPKCHTLDTARFAKLPDEVAADEDRMYGLTDAYQHMAEMLLEEGASIIAWTQSSLNDLMLSVSPIALKADLPLADQVNLFFLLVSGCVLADWATLPDVDPAQLTQAYLGHMDQSAPAAPAFHPLPMGQLLSLPQREEAYLLPTLTQLPEGAVLSPLRIESTPHALGSEMYTTNVHIALSPEEKCTHTLILALHRGCWLTTVRKDGKAVAVVDALRMTPGADIAVDVISHPVNGRLLLRADGTVDASHYKNTAHRLFLQEIRDEKLVEMRLNKGELLVLTDRGDVLSSIGREFDCGRILSLSNLPINKEADS